MKECDFIKCGSPLGEYELHCTKEQMQQILKNHNTIKDIIEISKRKPQTDEDKTIINCLKEILSENSITLHSKSQEGF